MAHRTGPPPNRGLQAERTALAWQRTALGLGGFSALLLHDTGGRPYLAIPGVVGLVTSVVLLLSVERRYERAVSRIEDGHSPAGTRLVRVVAATGVFLGLAAALLALAVPR